MHLFMGHCMHLFMGHIVSSLHILKERIFVFMCIGVASTFYRAYFFCMSLVLYLLLTFVVYVYYSPFDWVVFINT